jgi:GT2 family glycosyltransferase
VRVVALDSNRGWAGGNNRGIGEARGEFVLLLNNDACLGEGFYGRLREGMGRHPDADLFATKILDHHDRTRMDNAGHVIYWDGAARGRGRGRRDGPEFDAEEEVLCPSGAAGVYRRALFAKLGPIDDDYFAYGEDTEFGLRARKAGHRCVYLPGAVVYHRYSATGGAFTPGKVYLVERNRLWTVIKLFPWWLALLSPLFTLARYLHGLRGLLSGRGAVGRLREAHSARELFAAVARAEWDAAAKVPAMLRKRRGLKAACGMGGGEFFRTLSRFRAGVREVSFNE